MVRYQATLIYDGSDFSGMQRQAAARTVQGEVEKALQKIGWQSSSIVVASRTDAGVHASGQVIAFDFEWAHSQADMLNALNSSLPSDVAVSRVKGVSDKFHPRYDAISRIYRYTVFCQNTPDPLQEGYAWRVWPLVDIKKMQIAAKSLIGEHDFGSYGSPPTKGGTTTRKILRSKWQKLGQQIVFEIEANAFLYHMVRRIVHQQIEIGLGRHPTEIIAECLNGEPQNIIQGLAPPNGLNLIKIRYPSL